MHEMLNRKGGEKGDRSLTAQNLPNEPEKPQKSDSRSGARVLRTKIYATMKERDMRRDSVIERRNFRTGGWVRKSDRRPSQRMCARQAY